MLRFAGTFWEHLHKQRQRRARSQRKRVSEPKRLWGSHLRGGGEAGGGWGARQRKAQEADLARALSALVAKFSSQGVVNDQPPNDLSLKKGTTSYHSIGDNRNVNNSGSSKQLSKHKRRQMKRGQATGGLLGGLQKLVARHKPDDNLFEKLTKLLKLASEDKLHPGASAGKPKGKPQCREKKSDHVDKPAVDTQNKKLSYADKVKGKKPEPLPDPPTKLFAQHWAVQLLTVSHVANKVHVPQVGEHITFGILPGMPSPSTLQLIRPADSGTITFVLSKKPDSHESVEVRASAGTLRGATRSSKLHVVQFGEARAPTAWQADKITTVIKQRPSSFVLQAFVFSRHFSDEHWARISKNIYRTFPDLMRQAGLETKIIDTFRPAWIGNGNSKAIRANIRVLESDRDLLLSCSGIGGLLIKRFDDQHQIGSVQWIRRDENESGSQYMQRARRLAESDTPKAGLAFASSGSLGLRRPAGAVPSLWRLEGLQKFVDKSDVIALLSANGWADVLPQSKRIRREGASWIVRARRTGAVLPCYRYEVSVENSPEPCFVEIAPFKPMPKPLSVIHAKDKVQSFETSPQVRSVKGPGTPLADAPVNTGIAPNVVMMVLSFLLSP